MKSFNEFVKENKPIVRESEVFTNGKFWGTIGAGILPIARDTKRILLPYRSKDVNEPNTWGVWGGKLDDMETNDPKKAALTEFVEESGYNGEIELIDSYIFKKSNFTYYNYIGVLEHEFEPILNWETESFKWASFNEMIKMTPKHFGLESLLKNDLGNIVKTIKKF
jgi:8-oxo-dGTP pyrophosphatase MutT (NUDIX family)